MSDEKKAAMPMLIKAGDRRLLINGRPPLVDCRLIAEGRYQALIAAKAAECEYRECSRVAHSGQCPICQPAESPIPDARQLCRGFTLSELWAGSEGIKCSHPDCAEKTFTLYLTKAEDSQLPAPSGPEAALFIINNGFGEALCVGHRPYTESQLSPDESALSGEA